MEARIYIRIHNAHNTTEYEVNIDGEISSLGTLVSSLKDDDDITKLIKKVVQTALN